MDSKYNSYRDWIWQRKRLRGDLDRCDKTHDWLKCKADLSELEEKVYKVLPYPEIKPKTKLEEQHKVGQHSGHQMEFYVCALIFELSTFDFGIKEATRKRPCYKLYHDHQYYEIKLTKNNCECPCLVNYKITFLESMS